MTNKKEEINNKLHKLKKGIKHCAKKWDKVKNNLRWYSKEDPPLNVVVLRNFTYVRNILNKINSNVESIKKSSSEKITDKNQKEIDKKFLTSFLLLESIIKINDNYSVVQYDYEILNLKMFENENYSDFKDTSMTKMALKNKKDIIENFEDCKVRVVEKFGFLDPITDIIKEITDGFMMVVNGLIDVAKFIGNLLKDFVLLLFELLKMLYFFIVKIIPAIFTFLFKVMTGIWNRAHLIPISLFFLFLSILATFYVFIFIINKGDMVAMYMAKDQLSMMIACCVVLTIGMWWSDNGSMMLTFQKIVKEFFIWLFEGPVQWFFSMAFNVSLNDKMFRASKEPDAGKRMLYAFEHMIFNAPMIILRFFITIVVIRKSLEFFVPHFINYTPTLRELALVPFVIIRDIYVYSGLRDLIKGLFAGSTTMTEAYEAGVQRMNDVASAATEAANVAAEAATEAANAAVDVANQTFG